MDATAHGNCSFGGGGGGYVFDEAARLFEAIFFLSKCYFFFSPESPQVWTMINDDELGFPATLYLIRSFNIFIRVSSCKGIFGLDLFLLPKAIEKDGKGGGPVEEGCVSHLTASHARTHCCSCRHS